MAAPFVVKFDDFSRGWAGDIDRGKAMKGQWFGQDVLIYTDGLVGPRSPLRAVTLASPPSVTNQRVDEAIVYENPNATNAPNALFIASDSSGWYITNYANFDSNATLFATKALGGVIGAAVLSATETKIYWQLSTGANRMRADDPGGGTSNITLSGTIPTAEVFVRWQERMIYGYKDQIFWSDAASFGSWPAANTANIGDGGYITALIPAPLALYIAKTSGWWVITGVLSSTAILRQVYERQGVEPVQVTGGSGSTTKVGVRAVAAWERGMLWLRRRANDYRTDLTAGSVVPTVAVEHSELMSFTGAQMEKIATIRASRQARLVGLAQAAAVVDCRNVPEAPAVEHVVYFVNTDKSMSRHIISSAWVTTADQVMCPVQPVEGANGPVTGYEPDHLWLAYGADSTNLLQIRALRYKATRPGYGSDDPSTQVDDPSGTHANIVGVLEVPDYWHPEGRQMIVKEVVVVGKVYDNGYTSHYASTARCRATVTILGRVDQTGSGSNVDSTELEWSEVVAGGSGDRDMTIRFPVNDAGYGIGARLRLELEMFAVRAAWMVCDTGEIIR